MATGNQLESSLEDIFVKKAPALPAGGKKFLVEYLPWISLIGGLLTLWSAYSVWHWAHAVNSAINYLNGLSQAFGGTTVSVSRFSFWIWLSVAVLAIEGVVYLLAYTGLKDRKKAGWNYLYYGALLNVVYGVVIAFSSYGGVGNLIGALIGSAIGLWLLFQIRSSYTGVKSATSSTSTTSSSS